MTHVDHVDHVGSDDKIVETEMRRHLDSQAARIRELEASQVFDSEIIATLQDQVIEREMAYVHLEGAIASSRRIGAAVGIIMSAMRVTEDDALGVLAKIGRRQNRELRLVADDIVFTGAL